MVSSASQHRCPQGLSCSVSPRHTRNQHSRLTDGAPLELGFPGSFFGGVWSQSQLLNSEEGAGNLSHLLLGGEASRSAAGLPRLWQTQPAVGSSPPRSASANGAEGIARLLGAAEPLRKCFCLCSAARFPMLLGTGSQLS